MAVGVKNGPVAILNYRRLWDWNAVAVVMTVGVSPGSIGFLGRLRCFDSGRGFRNAVIIAVAVGLSTGSIDVLSHRFRYLGGSRFLLCDVWDLVAIAVAVTVAIGVSMGSIDLLIRSGSFDNVKNAVDTAMTVNMAIGSVGLLEVVKAVEPTVLIGTSTVAGAFTEEVIRTMAKKVDRPIIFPLSNPSRLHEVHPHKANEWTNGKALIATGSPFPPAKNPDGKEYT